MSLAFDSGVLFAHLPDTRLHPQQQRYTVTGVTIRKRRDKALGVQVNLNGKDVLLWRRDDYVFATSAHCPHQSSNMALGDLEDFQGNLCVVCPAHNWHFSLRSGRCVNHNFGGLMERFPAYVDESTGKVYVLFDSIHSSVFIDTDF